MTKKLLYTLGLAMVISSVASAQTYTNIVYSEPNDGMVELRSDWDPLEPALHWNNDGEEYATAGEWYSDFNAGVTGVTCIVLPFQLPSLGAVADPFTSADLDVYVSSLNQLGANIDLYYLGTAISNTILATDYYSGPFDVSAILLQNDFITPLTGSGLRINTDPSAEAALLAELNAAYASGAGAGHYVFLRLSYNQEWPSTSADAGTIATRNNSNQDIWPILRIADDVDSDMDGLPDSWEIKYGLDPNDNGEFPGDPDNGPSGDPDFDGLDNLNEFLQGTDPKEPDTDGDGLSDGEEVNTEGTEPLNTDTDGDYLSDGDEVNIYSTDPLDVDSDNDNVNDATEVYCGSDPNLIGDVPVNALPHIIGVDFFDYIDGTVYGKSGGEMFDVDNNISNDTYVGHTCDASIWYDTSFNAANVSYQSLITSSGTQGLRAFNGINTGGMTLGVFSDVAATGSTSSNLYFKVKMNLSGTVSYAGLSLYNGGDERLFFGKTGENGNWGIDGNDLASLVEGLSAPSNNVEYTIVGKVDFASVTRFVTLWLDPVIAAGEGAAAGDVIATTTVASNATYNALRLESGGTGSVLWDDLVVAYTWDGLDYAGEDSDADLLRDSWELVFTNTLTAFSSGADFDSDGLNDDEEMALRTDPTKTDSDGDGLDDGEEVDTYSTNPADADSDNDGLTDGEEINTYSTYPNNPDSDDDGYSDGVEVAEGTDPLNPTDNPGAAGTIIVDGSKDSLYGTPVSVQTVNTQFGDNLSELNAAYAFSTNGTLCLLITGNLENNYNKLDIFIDSSDAITTNVLDAVDELDFNNDRLDGLTFDSGFSPEYQITIGRDSTTFFIGIADMTIASNNISKYGDLFEGSAEGFAYTGTSNANANPIAVAFDNSNMAGVGGGTGAADTNAAIAVSTGIELCISLSDIGNPPTGTIKIAAMITGQNHDYLANQCLGGFTPPQDNLGGDGTGTYTGDLSGIDLTAFTGDQFFEVDVVAGGVVGPFSISSMQLISGNTEIQLMLDGLSVGQDYKIQDTTDLTAGFSDVSGSAFTATNATQDVILPVNPGAEPVRFFKGSSVAP